jgi:diguanylate cyclase (GGDEF)-like protein
LTASTCNDPVVMRRARPLAPVQPEPLPPALGRLRGVMMRSYRVLRESDPRTLRAIVLRDVQELLEATIVRAYEPDAGGVMRLLAGEDATAIPATAEAMEKELLPRALAGERSLLSTHPQLDPALAELAARSEREGVTTLLLLLRAHRRTLAAFGVHWLGGQDWPDYEQRSGFYSYWDTAGLAVATARERARVEAELEQLRRRAFWDALTGLPNALALEEELARHQTTTPFSALVLDFDGLREANSAFGYEQGGNVLIRSVGQGLVALARPGEFAARMHTAGDEFALLLPGADEAAARLRCDELEQALDALSVPLTHRSVYHGASVGWATRAASETPGQVVGRAVEAMRARKDERKKSAQA